jgi:hypothetical protein
VLRLVQDPRAQFSSSPISFSLDKPHGAGAACASFHEGSVPEFAGIGGVLLVPFSLWPVAASAILGRRSVRTILLASLLLLATSSRTLHAGPRPLTLTVTPSASTYNIGDQVALTVTLNNVSAGAVTASAYAPGNLRVVGLKRDGVAIRPSKTVMDFEEDPNLLRVEALTSIAPGGNASIHFDVDLDGTAGVILTGVKLGKGVHEHKAFVYRLSGPGLYTFTLRYRYKGPDNGQPSVFHGKLTSNEVSFQLN